MGVSLHTALGVGENHINHQWSYANETARLAASGFTSDDLLKWAYQEDNNTYWVLVATTPTWAQVGGTAGGITSDLVSVTKIGSPTYDDLRDYINNTGSASIVSGFEITDSGSGQIDVASGTAMIRTTDSEIGLIIQFDYAGASDISLTDNSLNWVYIRYNAGTPDVQVTVDLSSINFHSEAVIGKVYRNGTSLHILNSGQQFADYNLKNSLRLWEVYGTQHADGMITSETGTRNLDITAGTFYIGHNRFITDALNTSGSDRFSYWYNNGSWQEVSSQAQIDNIQYNDYGVGLSDLTVNRYGVHWVYLHDDGDLNVVYGQGDYLLSSAEAAQLPSNLPPEVTTTGILIAKIIVQKSASSFTDIIIPFNTQIVTSGVTDHGALGGLSDDDHVQYLLASGTRAMSGNLDIGSNNIVSAGTVNGVTVEGHAGRHENGGADEIDVSGLSGELADPQTVWVSDDGTPVGQQPEINFIEGTGITFTVADDAGNDRVNVTVASDNNGDVVGPSSSTDNALARFNGTGGKTLQNSDVTLDDDGHLGGIATATFGSTPTITPSGGTATCAFDDYQKIYLDLNNVATVTIQLQVPKGPGNFMLVVEQGDSTPTTSITWATEGSHALYGPLGGISIQAGAGTITLIGLFYDGSAWHASVTQEEQILAT